MGLFSVVLWPVGDKEWDDYKLPLGLQVKVNAR